MIAYLLLVGVPVLGLLGILEAGRGLSAPLAIGGEWTVIFDAAAPCAGEASGWRQPAMNISQSGTEARIVLNDGHATAFEAAINGSGLNSKILNAKISGKRGARTLEGEMQVGNCGPLAFRAVRQAGKKGAE